MKKEKRDRSRILWLCVVVLFVLVAVTTIGYSLVLNTYLPDDSGAIPLIPETVTPAPDGGEKKPDTPKAPESAPEPEAPATGGHGGFEKNPSAETFDDDQVWTTNSTFEIFRISDENGTGEITVQSVDGEKVIAPGMEFSYVFKIKNTGNVALDSEVEVNTYITPDDTVIPITGRLSRYDGKWIAGDEDNYAAPEVLGAAEDVTTLGAGKYAYYTLDWKWPFESGDDALDTMLGNMTITEEVTFTIEVCTTSYENPDPNADGGIGTPETGDEAQLVLWLTLACGALVILLILIFIDRRKRREEDAEGAEN